MTHRAPEPDEFAGWEGRPLVSWLFGNVGDTRTPLSRVVLFTAIPVWVFSGGFLLAHGFRSYDGPAWNTYLLLSSSAIVVVDSLAWRLRLRR